MLLGFTDTVLGRRYTIGIKCFSTDILYTISLQIISSVLIVANNECPGQD